MKVLIADKFPEKYVEELRTQGVEVAYEPGLGENDIPNHTEGINVIVVRSTKVNAAALTSSDSIKVIIRAGSGYNNIDTATATEKGIAVANTPGKNAIAVAELAMGLIISLDRKIPSNVSDFNNGVWNKATYSKSNGLYGKTLGVVGLGNIGRELATRAAAFGMKIKGFDIVEVKHPNVEYTTDLEALVAESDVISLHLPSNDKTKGLFGEKMFGLMKKGTLLVNTSRPQVVNEEALLKAIEEKNIVAGFDVFNDEPESKSGDVSSPLQNNANIYITHHIGASTNQAQEAVAEETVKIINTFKSNNEVLNKVN